MVVRPICEPVELPLGAAVVAESVSIASDAPAIGRLLHFHDVAELVLFDTVAGSFIADGRRHAITGGSVVFVPSMHHHDFDLAGGRKAWTLIQMDPYIVEQLALQPSFARLAAPICARPDAAARARMYMLAGWLLDVAAADPLDPLALRIVELLLIALAALPAGEQGEPVDHIGEVDRFLPAVERLRGAPGEELTLIEAASLCRLSPAYFSRRFKQVFGMNFVDYVRVYRLHLAARRLATTGGSISETAYSLGFSSPSHFTQRFAERFGMTPRAYRADARRRHAIRRAA